MGRVRIETLGCRLNQSEEALMAGLLAEAGWQVDFEGAAPADAVVIHGCAVTRQAERSSLQAIRAAKAAHCGGEVPVVAVTGCAAGAVQERDLRLAGADIILRRGECLEIAKALEAFYKSGASPRNPATTASGGVFPKPGEGDSPAGVSGIPPAMDGGPIRPFFSSGKALYRHGMDRAIVKVQDGCDFACAYCIVPILRGRAVSRPFADAVDAAKTAAAAGFREIVISGCNLACYSDGGRGLPDLLSAICAAASGLDVEISLGSVEPGICDEALAGVISANANCRRFIHLPVQSGDDRVLAIAGRRYTSGRIREIVFGYRAAVRGIEIGADFITGLPGEDDAAFSNTLGLVRELGFSPLHVFPFSPRQGTRAAGLPYAPPRAVAKERARILRASSRTVSRSSK